MKRLLIALIALLINTANSECLSDIQELSAACTELAHEYTKCESDLDTNINQLNAVNQQLEANWNNTDSIVVLYEQALTELEDSTTALVLSLDSIKINERNKDENWTLITAALGILTLIMIIDH